MNTSASNAWAPDYKHEFNRRLKNRNRLVNDKALQKIVQIHYANNCIDWIQDWAVTFDPRTGTNEETGEAVPRVMPFCLFPRQTEFVDFILDCYKTKEDGLIEKSRDMGATWLCAAISAWMYIYHPGTVVGWGSRKEGLVDNIGDPKAVFPKIRQILSYLPPWMIFEGYSEKVHAPFMRIINPTNGSSIIGEGGSNMGRGGRTSIYFKDESAHYEQAEMVEAALGDNTDVQIDMSSVNGTGNVFYNKRMAGEIWHPNHQLETGKTRVFIFDWKDHPKKTQEWYDRRKDKAEAEGLGHIFAQEVDRDYSGSQKRIIIRPEWVRAAIDAHLKLGVKASGPKIAGQDVADGGGDKNALVIMHGIVVRFADHWGGEADAAAHVAVPTCVELGVDELYYESTGVGAGFKGGINALTNLGALPSRLRVKPWNPAAKPLDPDDPCIPGDPQSPTNGEQYANLKAQGYFRLRARFYKTWRAVEHGERFNPDEIISIDSRIGRLHELTMELSQPVHKYGLSGKTIVDKAPDGTRSPNLSDALNIAANPNRGLSILDVL